MDSLPDFPIAPQSLHLLPDVIAYAQQAIISQPITVSQSCHTCPHQATCRTLTAALAPTVCEVARQVLPRRVWHRRIEAPAGHVFTADAARLWGVPYDASHHHMQCLDRMGLVVRVGRMLAVSIEVALVNPPPVRRENLCA